MRHDISFVKLSGESASANVEAANDFIKNFQIRYSHYEKKDIFNCDETGLFYRLLPNKSYINKNEFGHGTKSDVKRISVLFCCSYMGEKLNPLFIGYSKRPHSLSKIDLKKAEIAYDFNKKAWMNTTIFCKWLNELNQKFKNENRKVLLLLDNCSAHLKIELSHVEMVFFSTKYDFYFATVRWWHYKNIQRLL